MSHIHSPLTTTSSRIIKLVVLTVQGQIVRADIVKLRLRDCASVEDVISFSDPLQAYAGQPVQEEE
jgi:hypothetical protein